MYDNTIFLSLGSNIGNRKENLKKAIQFLKKNNIKIKKISSIYETEPIGYKNQPFFYNLCLVGKTDLKPEKLLKTLKKIEKEIGRKNGIKWGPRIIDIDILFYNNIIFKKRNLKIPHPEILKRKFVLVPLYELNKNYIHPEEKTTIKDLFKKTDLKEIVKKVK